MDLLCTRCGEPWEMTLDDFSPAYRKDFLKGKGCPCCHNLKTVTNINPGNSYIQRELAPLLGDDIDGLASMMDDVLG